MTTAIQRVPANSAASTASALRRPYELMDALPPSDFDPYKDSDDDMNIREGRDPLVIGSVVLGILINIGTLAWFGGKFDQRVTNAENEITDLKSKATKDAAQDVQLAVIGVQLTTISAGVGEIKAKLERK